MPILPRILSFGAQRRGARVLMIAVGLALTGCEDPVEPGPTGYLAYAVGDSSIVLGFDGETWSRLPGTTTEGGHKAVWGVSATEVYVTGWWDGMLRLDGEEATRLEAGLPEGLFRGVWNLWGTSGSDIWGVATHNTLVHYDGTSWSRSIPDPSTHFYGVWGSSPDDVFAVGERVWHFDGSGWAEMEFPRMDVYSSPRRIMEVWGTSGTNVFGVGWAGFYHYDGTAWTRMVTPYDVDPPGRHPLASVTGTSSTDVFAADTWGNIFHYDGTDWSLSYDGGEPGSGHGAALIDIHAASPTAVYAVGHGGLILHFDGSTWSRTESGTSVNLQRVWAPEPHM